MSDIKKLKWRGEMMDRTIDLCNRCAPVKWIAVCAALLLLFVGLMIEWVCTGRLPNKLG